MRGHKREEPLVSTIYTRHTSLLMTSVGGCRAGAFPKFYKRGNTLFTNPLQKRSFSPPFHHPLLQFPRQNNLLLLFRECYCVSVNSSAWNVIRCRVLVMQRGRMLQIICVVKGIPRELLSPLEYSVSVQVCGFPRCISLDAHLPNPFVTCCQTCQPTTDTLPHPVTLINNHTTVDNSMLRHWVKFVIPSFLPC